ncbi:hypothetical protein CEUSTIGMA_g13130.t1 [Chlamydomonas eustigma]|uniref:Uncharacterized protein n=1 Tax=Chlamydomonas eustigma TaxID=1157962 RepID=A0A250XRP3_9CHLO|nr:hypothetical protein CEUSTIGMA_g13130.t1 [Chlamydomonas eustigma]|eukprot:GAX85716.1 hypothetical protein CEUSTIGMA_g13130.t1 [Chlamydomonas eustigma]
MSDTSENNNFSKMVDELKKYFPDMDTSGFSKDVHYNVFNRKWCVYNDDKWHELNFQKAAIFFLRIAAQNNGKAVSDWVLTKQTLDNLHQCINCNSYKPCEVICTVKCCTAGLCQDETESSSADGGGDKRSVDGGGGGKRSVDGGKKSADGGKKSADGGKKSVDGGKKSADGGKKSMDNEQICKQLRDERKLNKAQQAEIDALKKDNASLLKENASLIQYKQALANENIELAKTNSILTSENASLIQDKQRMDEVCQCLTRSVQLTLAGRPSKRPKPDDA